jgi:hypothetical protein
LFSSNWKKRMNEKGEIFWDKSFSFVCWSINFRVGNYETDIFTWNMISII